MCLNPPISAAYAKQADHQSVHIYLSLSATFNIITLIATNLTVYLKHQSIKHLHVAEHPKNSPLEQSMDK